MCVLKFKEFVTHKHGKLRAETRAACGTLHATPVHYRENSAHVEPLWYDLARANFLGDKMRTSEF